MQCSAIYSEFLLSITIPLEVQQGATAKELTEVESPMSEKDLGLLSPKDMPRALNYNSFDIKKELICL